MCGEPGRDIALDLLDGTVGIGAGECEEDVGDPAERPAGALQRLDGIGKIGLVGIGHNGADLGIMRREGRLESGRELSRFDPLERRRFERTLRPVPEQRICGRRRELGGFVHGGTVLELAGLE
jgi:hypothetical protein